jgi:NADH-quinone oxidoreductase subunit H
MKLFADLAAAFWALLIFPGFGFLWACSLAFEWIDRRVSARLQGRVGPPWFQPLADWIKLLAKEDILPVGVRERACAALPIVSLAAVLTASLYIPVAGRAVRSFEGDLIVVLFLLSIPPLTYFLAGWMSVGIYSAIGGSRSLLQYFSYEVPFLMALSGPAILGGSWSISRIVDWQAQAIWMALLQPLGFVLAIVGLIGKLKRVPLDIPKAKSEIVAGPLTEFSGRKLALWNLSLHIKTVVGVFLLVNTFWGESRFVPELPVALSFAVKALLILLILSVSSVLYARLRIDQLANLGWRVLAPLGLLQTLFTVWIGVD